VTTTAPPGTEHSTPVSERALAPDLARGMMLLLIALAHTPWFLFTSEIGSTLMHPADGNLADRIAQAFTIIVVDARTHTMFAFLFAYGIGQLSARRMSRGADPAEVRRILRTRHLWLLVFGVVHALLLWQGDILGTYGLLGLLLVPLFFGRSDRTLKIWIGVFVGLLAVGTVLGTLVGLLFPAGDPVPNLQQLTIGETDVVAAAVLRLIGWGTALVSGLVSLVLPTAFLIGILASRHRILEEPERHLPLLRRLTVGGIALGWGAGALQALAHIGALDLANPAAFGTLHFTSGLATGVGYAALFGLVAHRIARRGDRPPLVARGVLALGRRSLSGYLAQSVVFVPLLSAWGLAFGAHLTSWSASLVAVATWSATVVLAYALDRRGIRGPAEVLLRRLTYRGR
jgi:uncharacterized protein